MYVQGEASSLLVWWVLGFVDPRKSCSWWQYGRRVGIHDRGLSLAVVAVGLYPSAFVARHISCDDTGRFRFKTSIREVIAEPGTILSVERIQDAGVDPSSPCFCQDDHKPDSRRDSVDRPSGGTPASPIECKSTNEDRPSYLQLRGAHELDHVHADPAPYRWSRA